MTPMQQLTVDYIKQGLLEFFLIICIAGMFTLIVTHDYSTQVTPEPKVECTECGCVTEAETFNLTSNVL